jgi:hypothetical protein
MVINSGKTNDSALVYSKRLAVKRLPRAFQGAKPG